MTDQIVWVVFDLDELVAVAWVVSRPLLTVEVADAVE